MSQGTFDGSMPRNVLEYYLAHAASAQWISQSETLDDDIRERSAKGIECLVKAGEHIGH